MINPSTQRQANGNGRGFADMDPERLRAVARLGGRAAHRSGAAHRFDAQEAREAGRKGGIAVSRDHRHMAEIGARGGAARSVQRDAVHPPMAH